VRLKRAGAPEEFDVALLARDGDALRVTVNGADFDVSIEPSNDGAALLTINGRRVAVRAARLRDNLTIAIGPNGFIFREAPARKSSGRAGSAGPEIVAPMPGKVLKILVSEGAAVAAGDPLIVLEAMKMETTLFAEGAAVVRKIGVDLGQMVDHGAVLLELSPAATSSAHESRDQNA
jgi:acetyl/propionyl-CoA carboxylase alpha subunit